MRKSHRVHFAGGNDAQLAGIIEEPAEEPIAAVLFTHCFTCTKDLKAIVRIARQLAEHGFLVLRFDFTGLGDSNGDFSQTNFTTNRRDVLAAAQYMRMNYAAPRLLIGHSLGGAAAMSAALEIPEAELISTLAAPSDTQHLAELLSRMNREIMEQGEGEVSIGGFKYLIKRQMIDDLNAHDLPAENANWQKPQLIFHSPSDTTLGLAHARRLLEQVGEDASLVSLKSADHLFTSDPRDVIYIADTIAAWATRYLK